MENEKLKGLLARVKGGDDVGFAVLAGEYDNLMRSIVFSFLLKCKDLGAEYDDLMQEAAMALYKAAVAYDPEREGVTFGLFAKICITNKLISVQRKLIRANVKKTAKGGAEKQRIRVPADDRQAVYQGTELSIFTGLERDVFNLYVEGCSYNEIAERLGRDVKSIDNAMYRIRRKLKGLRG
jgi:RNA polymerase sporulation-specific sigma factor